MRRGNLRFNPGGIKAVFSDGCIGIALARRQIDLVGRVTNADHVLRITLDRPKVMNALHAPMHAELEEALAGHEAVAMAGAIGQPDAHSGELPCAYVELVAGADVSGKDLRKYLEGKVERAAMPKHIEVLDELPKTAVGKVFKPDLRRLAISRVYDAALADAGVKSHVAGVREDKKLGLVARMAKDDGASEDDMNSVLGDFTRPWEWAD